MMRDACPHNGRHNFDGCNFKHAAGVWFLGLSVWVRARCGVKCSSRVALIKCNLPADKQTREEGGQPVTCESQHSLHSANDSCRWLSQAMFPLWLISVPSPPPPLPPTFSLPENVLKCFFGVYRIIPVCQQGRCNELSWFRQKQIGDCKHP